jgi:hypothetical protein
VSTATTGDGLAFVGDAARFDVGSARVKLAMVAAEPAAFNRHAGAWFVLALHRIPPRSIIDHKYPYRFCVNPSPTFESAAKTLLCDGVTGSGTVAVGDDASR